MDKKVLHTVIDSMAFPRTGAIAVESPGQDLTYQQLSMESDRIARSLKELGVTNGMVVGIYLQSGSHYIVSLLGVNKAAAIFLPLEVEHPISRLQQVLTSTMPCLIITQAAYSDQLGRLLHGISLSIQILVIDHPSSPAIKENNLTSSPVNGEDSCYLIYTSGSTGLPKIIEGCHKSLSHFIHWEVAEFKLDESVRIAQLAPISFDVSFRDIFVPLLAGGTLVIPESGIKMHPRNLIQWMGQKKITLIHTIPSLFKSIVNELERDPPLLVHLSTLTAVLLAGEPLHSKTIMNWRRIAGNSTVLVNLYGPSETTLAKLFYRIPEFLPEASHIIPLGKPIPNTAVAIIRDGNLCSRGMIGEIHIKTPFRTKGYYRQPEFTREKFIQNPLHNQYEDILYATGDLGKYGENDMVEFVGRADSQVKIRGNRVELLEVEKVILSLPGVSQVVAVASPDTAEDLTLVVYYVPEHKGKTVEIKNLLKDSLPSYMIPSITIMLEEFPVLINGKIDKKALPKPEFVLSEQYIDPPANDLEKQIAKLWKEVLGIKSVSVSRSFFDLGGHSLSATRIISRIFQETGKSISLSDFFLRPTIKGICSQLLSSSTSSGVLIPPAPASKYYPLSFEQQWFWVLNEVLQNQSTYNMPMAFFLSGPLNVRALQKSIQELVIRHEALRTRFVTILSEPFQEIIKNQAASIKLLDFSKNENPDQDFLEMIRNNAATVFDFSEASLFRATIVRLGEQRHGVLFTLHHIICDGWSLEVIMKELSILYRSFSTGLDNPLAPLKTQYKDYAVWQAQKLASSKLEILKRYWTEALTDIRAMDLPLDGERSSPESTVGEHFHLKMSAEKTKAITEFSQRNQVTVFATILAIIKLALHRITGSNDIVVGTPISGRTVTSLEDVVGLFLNSVVVRNRVTSHHSLLDFVRQVQQSMLGAFDHSEYPYRLLVSDLKSKTGGHRNSLYDVLVVMDTNGIVAGECNLSEDLTIAPASPGEINSKLDLSFLIKGSDELLIIIEYKPTLFYAETIERIANMLTCITDLILSEGMLKIHELHKRASLSDREHRENMVKIAIQEDF